MNSKSALIIFSGMDGAGKSSQIDLLNDTLISNGHRTKRIWVRGGYTPIFSFMKRMLRKSRSGAISAEGSSGARERKFESPRVRKVWLILAILDMFLVYGIHLRWFRLRQFTVLCDRYVEDTLLDFKRNFPAEDVESWLLWRVLCRMAPRPNYRFLLMVTPKLSTERGKLKDEPFPDSLETLSWRYERYLEFSASGGWVVLDCVQSIDAVQSEISRVLQL